MTTRRPIELTVNGRARSIAVVPHHTLLEVLRDDLGLTGTKECCLVGECGACTVLVDGLSVDSCLMLAVEADGATVTTVEGLATGTGSTPSNRRSSTPAPPSAGSASRVSWSRRRRCSRSPRTRSRAEVEEGLAGNLCRCAGYEQIIEAVLAAAAGGGHETTSVAPPVGERSAIPDATVAPQ